MDDIGIFSFGRKESERCPNKMLRPYAGTTVTDIVLKKLRVLGDNTFFAGYDGEFKDKCKDHGINFVQRSKKSATIDGPLVECLSFLHDVDYEYLLCINGCLTFLEIDTIKAFLDGAIANDLKPAINVRKRYNYFYDHNYQPLNFSFSTDSINTKIVEPLYEFGNCLYFYNREYFLKNGMYWDWHELRLVEMGSKLEMMDIDTMEDFIFAENIYKAKNVK